MKHIGKMMVGYNLTLKQMREGWVKNTGIKPSSVFRGDLLFDDGWVVYDAVYGGWLWEIRNKYTYEIIAHRPKIIIDK